MRQEKHHHEPLRKEVFEAEIDALYREQAEHMKEVLRIRARIHFMLIVLDAIKKGDDPMKYINEEYERIDSALDRANKGRFFTELYKYLENM